MLSKLENFKECNVYGVAVPHCDGRAGAAAVRLPPSISLANIDFPAVYKHLSTVLPSYARPLFFRFLNQG